MKTILVGGNRHGEVIELRELLPEIQMSAAFSAPGRRSNAGTQYHINPEVPMTVRCSRCGGIMEYRAGGERSLTIRLVHVSTPALDYFSNRCPEMPMVCATRELDITSVQDNRITDDHL